MTELPLQEFGFAAGVTGLLLTLFIWFVRAARHDVQKSNASAELATREFTDYLKTTAMRQTEVLVGVANTLDRMRRTSDLHEQRAHRRHDEILGVMRARADPAATERARNAGAGPD